MRGVQIIQTALNSAYCKIVPSGYSSNEPLADLRAKYLLWRMMPVSKRAKRYTIAKAISPTWMTTIFRSSWISLRINTTTITTIVITNHYKLNLANTKIDRSDVTPIELSRSSQYIVTSRIELVQMQIQTVSNYDTASDNSHLYSSSTNIFHR